jgi:Fe-S cluster assembly ATPase SufC
MATTGTTMEPTTATDAATLEIRGLHATVEGKEILKGIDLTVTQGEVHALMGPNGSASRRSRTC